VYISKRSLYDITFPNVHAPRENKTDGMNDSFCGELECMLDKFPEDHMKILAKWVGKIFSN
jgi:hypothetical protein